MHNQTVFSRSYVLYILFDQSYINFFYRLQGFLTIMWLFFLQGCYDKLEEYIKQNGIIIGTAAIVTAVFMVNSHCNTNIPASNINYQDWFLSLLKTNYIHTSN